MRARSHKTRKQGFTYVEIVIAMGVMLMTLGSAIMMSYRTGEALRTRGARADVEIHARRAMQRVLDELAVARYAMLDPVPNGGSAVDYYRPEDFVAGAIVWGSKSRLSLQYEVGEVDDGLDNNGNGLVDECFLLYTRDADGPGEQRVVLCRNLSELLEGEVPNGLDDNGNGLIDEQGLCLLGVGTNRLEISLTVEGIDSNGIRFQRTMSSSTRLRN